MVLLANVLLKLTLFLLDVNISWSQRDCTGMECPLLENCIQEVLESGACCASCVQKGCICEGYQYYDCVNAGFRNGKVPEGDSYFVDYGSTECSCPMGGGRIGCRFISCPDVPPNCIEVTEPADACVQCERVGCIQDGNKYDSGHSFHVDPCRVCHCPNEGGKLMCYTVPDCELQKGHQAMLPAPSPPEDSAGVSERFPYRLDPQQHVGEFSTPYQPPPEGKLPLFNAPALDKDELEGYDDGPTDIPEVFPQPLVLATQVAPSDKVVSVLRDSDKLNRTAAHQGFDRKGKQELRERSGAHDDPTDKDQVTERPATGERSSVAPLIPEDTATSWQLSQDRSAPSSSSLQTDGTFLLSDRESFGTVILLLNKDQDSEGSPHYPHAENVINVQRSSEMTAENASDCLTFSSSDASHRDRDEETPTALGTAPTPILESQETVSPYFTEEFDEDVVSLRTVTAPEGGEGPDSVDSVQLKENHEESEIRGPNSTYPETIPQPPTTSARTTTSSSSKRSEHQTTHTVYSSSTPHPPDHRPSTQKSTQRLVNAPTQREEVQKKTHLTSDRPALLNNPDGDLFHSCCSSGHSWASHNNHCKHLPVIHNDKDSICSVVMRQCCLSSIKESQCQSGMISARGGRCEEEEEEAHCSDHNYQVCCRCCLLGLRVRSDGRSCNIHQYLGFPCGHIFLTCCEEEEQEDLSSRNVLRPKHQPRATALPQNVSPAEDKTSVQEEDHPVAPPTPSSTSTSSTSSTSSTTSTSSTSSTTSTTSTSSRSPVHRRPCTGNGGCSQQCRAVGGYARCSCFPGFSLNADGRTCRDVDECFVGTHTCGSSSKCENTQGSFVCSVKHKHKCISGFKLDEHGNCIDINECVTVAEACAIGLTCINSVGSFTCQQKSISCNHGYHASTDGRTCVDVDECHVGTHHCGLGQICHNLPGSFRCDCQTGYEYDHLRKICNDINECWRFPSRLCSQTCENTPGSFHCSCTAGFTLALDAKNCEDINECDKQPCSQECTNIYGSYQCYCRHGYYLKEDRHTCEDIDECSQSIRNLCTFKCVNLPGSYQCTCPPHGYIMAANGRTCKDVDECSSGSHNCSGTQTCFNLQGGFRCLSLNCPHNYNKVSDTRCERVSCPANSLDCQNSPSRITFYQLSYQTDVITPAQIFRIGPSPAYAGDHVVIAITRGNEDGYFSTRKLNSFMGAVYLQRQVREPRDFLLDVEIKLLRQGVLTSFVARIYVFITSSVV